MPSGSTSTAAPPSTPVPSAAIHAPDAAPLPTPQFRRYSMDDGLPSTSVYAIAQDHDGAMWFGTKSGIARFDGVHFQVFRHIENDPDSLFNNNISTLLVDRQGMVWAGGLDGGLSRYDPATGKFSHWGHDPGNPNSLISDRVWVIAQTPDGVIWVGTSDGLDRMLPDGHSFEHISNPLLGLYPRDMGTVDALYADPKGRLWVGTERGVFRRDTDGQFVSIKPLDPDQSMDAWRIDGEGDEVRISTERGLLVVGADDQARLFGAPVIPHELNVMTSTRDAAGHLWIGTQRGMYLQVRPDGPITAVMDQPLLFGNLPGSWVWQTFVDREGGLWVAMLDGGVAYLAPRWNSFSRFTHVPDDPDSLRDSQATTMARGRDGRHIWVGERDGRIDRLDPITGSVEHILSGLHGSVLGMTEDGRQRLWIAVQGALYRYDYVHNRLDQVDPQMTKLNRPLEVEPGPDGNMYARTFGYGLFRVDPDTLAVTEVAMDKPNEKVMWGSEMMLYKGAFWYASDGGLMWLDQAHDRFVMVPGVPTNQPINAFDFDRTGIWLVTEDGLTHYHRQGPGLVLDRTVAASEGWPSLQAVDLDVDCFGRLWIFSVDGLWRFDPAHDSFHQLGLQDGLANGEFSRGYALLPNGNLYAATMGGVVGFNPDKQDVTPVTPVLSVTQVTVMRKGVLQSLPLSPQPIKVGWHDSQLHVQARLFSYINPGANHYRFRLDGFDGEWVDHDNHGEREFTGLGSGDYTLEIMAHGADGGWVHLDSPLRIHVQSPPWLRWWAWLLYACLIAALACLSLLAWRRRLAHRHRIQLAEQRHQIAEQASAAKSQFLATLSHEIRTPMTGVIGMAELLLSTPLNETQREYAESMQRSSNVLLKLLNDALDMARIEAGRLVLEPAPFDVRALVQDVERLQKNAAKAKGLAFDVQVDDGVPASLIGDPLRIRQVLFNLANNAVKFTVHGRVSIQVRWLDDHLWLDVSDTGPGISEHSRVRMFRRFEQDEGPQRSVGSGLGLAICSELVNLMGGNLSLESALGKGSTFRVCLPLRVSQEAVRANSDKPESSEKRALDVLLVESDATVASAIRGMLEHQGHRVRCASHGLNALAELAQESCDVILLDLELPGIDGFQLAQLIRQGEGDGDRMPIIAISSRTHAEEAARGHQAGIDGFLHKPLTGGQLSSALSAALSVRAAIKSEADSAC
ncbi:response regulator [Dyella flava]|uniref:histidine kinase n=2 Tax=Dyella flava TaxID=1920170 RepID=A0ABS2K6Z1_9GAMM|nr:hybrid sensor histidine kinase/response regulator [Dyella flava]MBM7126982.1 response regulator [Dyella flava]